MKNLPKLYSNLSSQEKYDLLDRMYIQEQKSFADIAEEFTTYANKLRRDAQSFKIPIRNKSEAQKNALSTGKHKHPTKGSQRSESTKAKIGKSIMGFWDSLDTLELEKRKEKFRDNWNSLSEEEKSNMQQAATVAVRKASKEGSKLEKFILTKLLHSGYKVDFHKEHHLVNTRLQIDLFISSINVAIEIDGPSHFLPVWGEDALKKNISYDQKKQGLILGRGWVLIRIKQLRDFSKTRSDLLFDRLLPILEQIKNKFPEPDHRIFTIED